MALKRIPIENNNLADIFNEINLLREIDHPNIIKYYESF